LGLELKIRHRAKIVNIVNNLYAKFNDDRLRNGKVIVLITTGTTTTTTRTTFVAIGDTFPGPMIIIIM